MRCLFAVGLALALLAKVACAENKGPVTEIDGLKSKTPDTWKQQEPNSSMRAYHFIIPKEKGDEHDAELIVFFFGRGGGGGVKANITRWKGLITPPAGKTIDDVAKVEEMKVGDVKVTVFDASGTYTHKTRPADPNDKGEIFDDKGNRLTRPGILADYFPAPFPNDNAARANNNSALPPDLSMIVKAREGGENYVYSILTGFHQTPPKGFTVTANKYYNPYFEGWNISMPPPLTANGVSYSDGTKATIEQEAHDVATFLAWASDPKMEERKQMGLSVLIFLVVLAGVLFAAYRKVWADAH